MTCAFNQRPVRATSDQLRKERPVLRGLGLTSLRLVQADQRAQGGGAPLARDRARRLEAFVHGQENRLRLGVSSLEPQRIANALSGDVDHRAAATKRETVD